MQNIRTESGARVANEAILVKLENPERLGVYWLKLDLADQDLIFDGLKVQNPPRSIGLVFDDLKAQIHPKLPNLNLKRQHLDLIKIAKYIGYLRGYWDDPEPVRADEDAEIYIDRHYGVTILVRQMSSASSIAFNASEQRFVYNKEKQGLSERQICTELVAQQTRDSPHISYIQYSTIGVLMAFMKRQFRNHPQDQSVHWNWVRTPYNIAQGELPTTRPQLISQPQSALAPATPAAAPPAAAPPAAALPAAAPPAGTPPAAAAWDRSPPKPYTGQDPNSPTHNLLHFGGSTSQGGGQGS